MLCSLPILTACGDERERRANEPRGALPVVISVFMTADGVRVSPESVGAGALEFVIANRSRAAREVVVERASEGTGGEILRTTKIADGETSSAQAIADEGGHIVRVSGLGTADLEVTKTRPSSSDRLITP